MNFFIIDGNMFFFFLISNKTFIKHEKTQTAITSVHDGEHKKQQTKTTEKRKRSNLRGTSKGRKEL